MENFIQVNYFILLLVYKKRNDFQASTMREDHIWMGTIHSYFLKEIGDKKCGITWAKNSTELILGRNFSTVIEVLKLGPI